ncbi:aspartate--tRNA ligase [Spiroplasma endosymbiont of Labia minor]|uniref:aspartate--tRNA ligase n=1 Tax=Spiroplasma endosymbiont of Labia minor TaxID=3066305 RepID=UPI0030CBFC56
MIRTHNCGELTLKNISQTVILQGWVKKIRKLGSLTFIDIRDQYGITQLNISESFLNGKNIKTEFVIQVEGKIIERKSKNLKISTGEIEVEVTKLQIINESEVTPFMIEDDITALEDTRMKYRYLDLRRSEIQNKLLLRSKMNWTIRNFFVKQNFIEIETPVLGKSTPEGARDFLVPSRVNKHEFYALPQSPQLYKQLLMVAGFDRYFQIAKCFRDEDLRIDRQPEFTQLDMEMSFANASDVQNEIENLMVEIFENTLNKKIATPFLKMTYKDAIDKYGSDKPDLRFGYEIKTFNEFNLTTQIELFLNVLNKQNVIRGIIIDKLLSKTEIEKLTETAKQNKANWLTFIKYDNDLWSGPIASKIADQEKQQLKKRFLEFKSNQFTVLFVGDEFTKASMILGAIRNTLGTILNIKAANEFKFLWVIDFPLFEWSDEEEKFVAAHHPFTQPAEISIDTFDIDKANALAKAYDIVLNGFEIGGGSERINDKKIQERMFSAIGLTQDLIDKKFGWFVNAYKYGAPYHSGCALGLDRIAMLLTNANNIREIIAFPKNSSGIDMMMKAPSEVSEFQLKELHIKLDD